MSRSRIHPMVRSNSLAALVGGFIDRQGWTIAEAARQSGISYRQLYRIVNDDDGGRFIQPQTVNRLEAIGLQRSDLSLAIFATPKEIVAP